MIKSIRYNKSRKSYLLINDNYEYEFSFYNNILEVILYLLDDYPRRLSTVKLSSPLFMYDDHHFNSILFIISDGTNGSITIDNVRESDRSKMIRFINKFNKKYNLFIELINI